MKRILGLTIAFMLLIGMVGIGTFAYFSDVDTVSSNQLSAGTLDLKTNDADGVSQTLYAINMAPGDTVGPQTITLKNGVRYFPIRVQLSLFPPKPWSITSASPFPPSRY